MTDTITLPRQTVQQALKALESRYAPGSLERCGDAITALWTALEQQQAEPVCPDCKAAVLYECVGCSSNNYPQQQAEPATSYKLDSTETAAVAPEFYWLPIDQNTPTGVKILLLGRGGVASLGQYLHRPNETQFWTHWAPLPRKRKE